VTDTLIPVAQPIPGEAGQQPRVANPRFVAQQPHSVVFTAPNVDVSFEHGLGRVPAGYQVVGRSAGLVVYDGAASPSADYLVLRATAAGTARILVL
jgi:hypothetical protein